MNDRDAAVTFAQLLARARELASTGRRTLLGITGPPGAGKSTLAAALAASLRASGGPAVAHVPMDGFHLADVELDRLGRRDRKGAPDTFDPAGYRALLARLRADGDEVVYAPAFERDLEQPVAGSIPVDPAVRLVLTEGNYLLEDGPWAEVRALLDEIWWVDAAEAQRVERLVERHELTGRDPAAALAFARDVDGANARRIAGSRQRADRHVPGDLAL